MAEHDNLFKRIFSVPVRAAEELRCVLPPSVAISIDFSSLTPLPTEYVTKEMQRQHADLLFEAPLVGSGRSIYVLFEHQSTPDAIMPLRVLSYMRHIWGLHLRSEKGPTLPPIINIVIHHSDRTWQNAPRSMHEMVHALDTTPQLPQFVPSFSLLVEDLTAVDPATLASRPLSPIVKVTLWLLRDARDPDTLIANLPRWAHDLQRLVGADPRDEDTSFLMEYILKVSGPDTVQRILEVLHQIAPDAEKHMESAYDEIHRKGLEQGLEQGLEATREMFRDMLVQRFGELDEPASQRITRATFEQLRRWGPRIIKAPTLEAIFTD